VWPLTDVHPEEVDLLARPVRLEEADDLDRAIAADLGLVKADAHGFEFVAQHPGANADLEPTV
jgi:hypothetical protein